jgi:hypothetical protein
MCGSLQDAEELIIIIIIINGATAQIEPWPP